MKKNLKFVLPLIILLTVLVVIKFIQPKKLNWEESFSSGDKIPFGCYVLYDILPELFPGNSAKIKNANFPIYNILKNNYYSNTNYIIINNRFQPDRLDIQYLLDFVYDGNDVFIAAESFSGDFQDSLRFLTYSYFAEEDTAQIKFTSDLLSEDSVYFFDTGYFGAYFSEYDTAVTEILAVNSENNPVFINTHYGEGNIYLCSIPLSYTNFYLLNESTNDYVFKTLSYLKKQNVIWDEYYKIKNKFTSTPLRFIISQPALTWAYYLTLAGAVLFIIFYGRKRQRKIPVINPLTNTTLEFVDTVCNLYLQQKDHKNIAQKNSIFFFEYLRNKYYLHSGESDEQAMRVLANKTGYEFEKFKSLLIQLKAIFNRNNITETELLYLNNMIESFYKKTGRYGK